MPLLDWISVDTPDSLFSFLANAYSDQALGIISIDWGGCPACLEESPYVAFRNSLPFRWQGRSADLMYGICTWRKTVSPPDFSEPVHRSYKLLQYALRTHEQRYGGCKTFETFTNLDEPSYWRPKFPQLVFIDGQDIDIARLNELSDLHTDGKLWAPFYGNFETNSLFDYLSVEKGRLDSAELDDKERAELKAMRRAQSGDLQIVNDDTRRAVGAMLANALLLQLTNYNLYNADGDPPAGFMLSETIDSCDCVVTQFETDRLAQTNCFRFDRRD